MGMQEGRNFRFPNSQEVPARSVDNEVIWVNPRLASSIDLKVGDRDPAIAIIVPEGPDADTTLVVRFGNYRSALKTGQGAVMQRFPYDDQKGVGYSEPGWDKEYRFDASRIKGSRWEEKGKRERRKNYGGDAVPLGLFDITSAFHDIENTEKLIAAGVRVGCVLSSVTRLKELPVKKRLSRRQRTVAVRTGYPFQKSKASGGTFSKDLLPVVMTRHYSWPVRVSDLRGGACKPSQSENSKEALAERVFMIDATIRKVSEEFGRHFSYAEYLLWFAETLGTNIGRMHTAGYFHKYLHPQNVTADCGIMDNDSVREIPKQAFLAALAKAQDHQKIKDTTGGMAVIRRLHITLLSVPAIAAEIRSASSKKLENAYVRAYERETGEPVRTAMDVSLHG